jgi:hypothetical protein
MLSLFKSVKQTSVIEMFDIHNWLFDIKDGSYKKDVEYVRNIQDKVEIQKIKETELPCVVYNFQLYEKRNTQNIASATGYFFIDIDVPFDVRLLNTSKIFAYYRSLRGTGYHILVKVDGLTIDNYNDAYSYIINDLGLEYYVDKCAKGIIQASLISYDPDLFLNDDSLTFDLSKLISSVPQSQYINKTIKEEHIRAKGVQQRYRFNNIRDFEFDGKDYIVDWGNIDFIASYKGKNIRIGRRNKVLFDFTRNFVFLNQHLSYEETLSVISNVNISMFDTPLEYKQVISIVTSIIKYKQAGTLKPIIKKRSIIFNPQSKYTPQEKNERTLELLAERKTDMSKEKIRSILETWDFDAYGLISVRNIANNHSISKKTVAKYYKEFKNDIQEMNMAEKLSNNK